MEGVVLVEMSSGALHYTKSFSEAFDARHPKTERLNLSALIFALQNFAGSSTRSVDNYASNDELAASDGAQIMMFATPLENIVLAATPSSKLLVVLFTEPDFDAHLAQWLVRRVASNYENAESFEVQLMTTLNQISRRFRHAFSQAIDEAVEHQLMSLSEDIFLSRLKDVKNGQGVPGDTDMFLFFYYSARSDDSFSNVCSDEEVEKRNSGAKVANLDDREEECRKAVRSVNPSLSDISRGSTQNISIRNIMASTRAMISSPAKRSTSRTKKPKKKTRWGAKNAVMNHSDPQEFRRVIEICWNKRKLYHYLHQS
ncbi:Ribonucleoprotein LSM domain [Phytophthora cinnamomi]|uniref:Ribonucleoprotein LSM domain n=1 Tax=Phytophthora cinnamomi TaxID=4785 RepID=UPI00355A657F|nr:Ribonucleoprotein LSM domain [Phytophthora cinnamomi]